LFISSHYYSFNNSVESFCSFFKTIKTPTLPSLPHRWGEEIYNLLTYKEKYHAIQPRRPHSGY
ncbi:hypothetical protein, partial [Klebsiella variicola]|uniref:hypothetical protein n=1 Tax=Klebsiella variicola TaxID=244366 RepID=UPI001A8DC6BF